MAIRPIFVPRRSGTQLVDEIDVEFKWSPGMAPSQKKKNIVALHAAAKAMGLTRLLEISSKSDDEVGRRLSAFSLLATFEGMPTYFECLYQGSKVFQNGGPYKDLYDASPLAAKKDPRLRQSGALVAFEFNEQRFPLSPKNAFYDWLYIKALFPHNAWIDEHISYQGYTDIEFNPSKSVNCQARAFAEFRALSERGILERAAADFSYFSHLLPPI